MSPRIGSREQEAPDYSEGRTTSVEIQERHLLAQHDLIVDYDWAVTGGGGAGDILDDAAYRLVRELSVESGQGTLHHVRGDTLGVIQRLWGTEEYAQTDPTTDAAGTDEDDRQAIIPIPYYVLHSLTPYEAALPTWAAQARLQVTWDDISALVDGEDGDPAIDNAATQLIERPIFGVSKKPASRWAGMSIRKVERAITQDGSVIFDLDHLTRGQELMVVIVQGMAKDDSNDDEYLFDDSVVTKIGPLDIDGSEEFRRTRADAIQQRNKVVYERSSLETGVWVLDAAEDMRTGRGELWTVRGEERPELEIEVVKATNATRVIVTTIALTRGRRDR